ncbi:DUF2513 domain-containing protein [Fusobacterium sp.]|uniref:DUF2513 domain-containing protein n=1 Tax=Fusobacterium sp. TaxID=68766 RepID=UPI00262FCDB4|nr:DUF2513 domain-containing protein [Fusobacterium sp.]
MKLNPDCIRDILIFVEQNTSHNTIIRVYSNSNDILPLYDKDEFFYHVEQCIMADFIIGEVFSNSCKIKCLTPKGHTFLENIRQNTIWNKVKDHAKQVGSFSLESIFQISSTVISEVIKKHLNLL